ncbi:MAG: alkaline phosphatase D family protein [Bacteroidota bacterium]|nr:alkaline phosphatase D family protein [Bacteroidota bacterium]
MIQKILKSAFALILTVLILPASGQKNLLQSGPMTGYSEMLEVMLWVQTTEQAKVKIRYTNTKDAEDQHWTNTVLTQKETAYTAHLLADQVTPGNHYTYDLYINNKKIALDYACKFETLELWQWRTEPPAFSFATGSGTFINDEKYDRPGDGYGGDYQIFQSITEDKPNFMLWLGDNTYLREPDWNTMTGIQHRNTHTRSTKEMQPLLAQMHNYAIWDDHDFGPNNSDKGFPFKNMTLEAFKQFWANPSYGVGDTKGAISYFNWNDCDFFLLDNRYHRDPNKRIMPNKTMLGEEQKEWLKDALVFSKANFKFVVMGGQFLTTSGMFETYTNYGFLQERAELIEFIHQHKLSNVVFVTGDRHHSEVSVLDRAGFPNIYDITISPLTSHHASKHDNEVNALRVPGSLINARNYAIFNLSGTYKERQLHIVFYDSDGKELYNYSIDKYKKENQSH